jgi:pimeloyl-ACP methyl ester carboxylesterase/glyoxylase-like metal-dependent hydrolase (beta-lactamase superfamily II)
MNNRMKFNARWRLGIVFGALLLIVCAAVVLCISDKPSSRPRSPELEYLKSVNSVAPPKDPQLLFLLMTQFASSNLHVEGAEFFSARLKEFDRQLTPVQKSLYLGIIGLLRVQHASSVPLLSRYGYVKDTIAILDEAKQLSGGQVFVVNWIAGIVHTELPGYFHQRTTAKEELAWCVDHLDKAPHPAWLREVYFHLGKLALNDGDKAKAQEYLKRSGYSDFDKPITLATPFSEDRTSGHAFVPRRIAEIVPGRVYSLSGFEFTEYYFVVSRDRRHLIGIDAGTRPDSAKGAYEALQAYAPGLPPLTSVFITHAHWDHVGGHSYFRTLHPSPSFYGRGNYKEEFEHEFNGPDIFAKQFFGERFSSDDVLSYKPDVAIDTRTEVTIGGSKFDLIPVRGGETHDAMLIYLPDEKVMFMGDVIMPYLGAPFDEEGDIQGLFDAIDVVVDRNPQHLLHGHEPLTRNFSSALILSQLKTDLEWLRNQVVTAVRRGDERAAIHESNLIPPSLLKDQPDAYQPYYILREHVIDRIYDQNVGYWEANLQGLAHPSRRDRAELLVDYLGLSEGQIAKAADRLSADGKYEMAANLIENAEDKFPNSDSLKRARRFAYLKLMEKNQNTDPFKFIIYSGKIGEQTPQMNADWQDPSPHRVRFVSVEKGLQLEVLDWGGSGRAIVLLAASGCTAHEFDDFAPKLAKHYHVYGITRRGFGSSGYVDGEYGIDLLGNDVLAVITTLKLEKPVLVGHSFAGGELSSIANRYPNRTAGVVYLDAGYPVAFDNGKGMSMAEFQEIVREPPVPTPGAGDLASFSALQTYYERMHGIRLPEEELRQEWEAMPDGRVGQRRSFPGSPTLMKGTKKYTDIPVPALIIFANPHSLGPWLDDNHDASLRAAVKIYSAKFEAYTRKQEEAIRAVVGTARVITLPGANHFVFMSNEANVLGEMRAFLAGLH